MKRGSRKLWVMALAFAFCFTMFPAQAVMAGSFKLSIKADNDKNIIYPDGLINLTVEVDPDTAGLSYTWTSGSTNIAVVSQTTGNTTTVTASPVGVRDKTKIWLTATDGTRTEKVYYEVDVRDIPVPKKITISGKSTIYLKAADNTAQLTAKVTPSDAPGTVLWDFESNGTASNPVAEIIGDGLVKGCNPGTATVIASIANTSAIGKYTITVIDTNGIAPTSVTITAPNGQNELLYDESASTRATVTLTARVMPAGASQDVDWTTSNAGVASVEADGKVTAESPGTAFIYATAKGSTRKATYRIDVRPAPREINTRKEPLYINLYKSLAVGASVYPSTAAKGLVWEISPDGNGNGSYRTDVVSLTHTGIVKGMQVGTTRVRVSSIVDATRYAEFDVVVIGTPVKSVAISPAALTLTTGTTGTLKPVILPADADFSVNAAASVTWKSSKPGIADFEKDASGNVIVSGGEVNVIAQSKGSTVVSCSLPDGRRATCTVTVREAPNEILINGKNEYIGSLQQGKKMTLKVSAKPAGHSNVVEWKIDSGGEYVTLDKGVLTALLNDGKSPPPVVELTATAPNGEGGTVMATAKITIVFAPVIGVKFDPTSAKIDMNIKKYLDMSGMISIEPAKADNKAVTYVSSRPGVASFDHPSNPGPSVLTAHGKGTTVITVYTVDGNRKATCTVVVTPVTTSAP